MVFIVFRLAVARRTLPQFALLSMHSHYRLLVLAEDLLRSLPVPLG